MVRDSAITVESLLETNITLSNGTTDEFQRPSFPKMGVPNAPAVICRISNGHISATGHPIHFMFGSKVGFSGSADRISLCLVRSDPR